LLLHLTLKEGILLLYRSEFHYEFCVMACTTVTYQLM
jgi:hypothetical protein